MRVVSKLLKTVERSSLYTPKHHHIFRSESAAAINKDILLDKDRLMLRRFRWTSTLDDSRISSDLSPQNFTSINKLNSLFSESLRHRSFFCGTSTNYYSPLSPTDLSLLPSPIETSHFPPFSGYDVIGSCGGVVCLESWDDVVFWNPTTNKVKFLPPSELGRPDPAEIHPSLSVSAFTYTRGFGFDSKSNDYKYIRWVYFFFEEEETYQVQKEYVVREIYSLKSNSWRKPIAASRGVGIADGPACINGDSYWSINPDNPTVIMRFNFSNEEFSYIPFPPHSPEKLERYKYVHSLFDFGGKLAVVIYDRESRKGTVVDKSFELWSLDNGESWRRVFDDCIEAESPLGFTKDGSTMFLAGTDRELLAYDVRSNKVKRLGVYCSKYGLDVIPYLETDLPLN